MRLVSGRLTASNTIAVIEGLGGRSVRSGNCREKDSRVPKTKAQSGMRKGKPFEEMQNIIIRYIYINNAAHSKFKVLSIVNKALGPRAPRTRKAVHRFIA